MANNKKKKKNCVIIQSFINPRTPFLAEWPEKSTINLKVLMFSYFTKFPSSPVMSSKKVFSCSITVTYILPYSPSQFSCVPQTVTSSSTVFCVSYSLRLCYSLFSLVLLCVLLHYISFFWIIASSVVILLLFCSCSVLLFNALVHYLLFYFIISHCVVLLAVVLYYLLFRCTASCCFTLLPILNYWLIQSKTLQTQQHTI